MLVNWDKIVQTEALKYYKARPFRLTFVDDKDAETKIEIFLKYTKLAKAVTLMKVDKGTLICGHSDCGKIVRTMMQAEHNFIIGTGATRGLNGQHSVSVVYKVLDALVQSKTWTDETTKLAVQASLAKSDVLTDNVRTYFGISQSAVVPKQFVNTETAAAGPAAGPAAGGTGGTGTGGAPKIGGNKTLRGGGWRNDFTRRIRHV